MNEKYIQQEIIDRLLFRIIIQKNRKNLTNLQIIENDKDEVYNPYDLILIYSKDFKRHISLIELKNRNFEDTKYNTQYIEVKKINRLINLKKMLEEKYEDAIVNVFIVYFFTNNKYKSFKINDFMLNNNLYIKEKRLMNKNTIEDNDEKVEKEVYVLNNNLAKENNIY